MESQRLRESTQLVVCKDPDDLAVKAAELIEQTAQEAIGNRGRFILALSGGSTPLKTYLLLAHPHRPAPIAWPKTFVFFSDERFVPADDSRSNYGLAKKCLLDRVKIPPAQIFPVPVETPSAAESALCYSKTLNDFFSAFEGTTTPRFDLILLGLGEDGHTASLLPHAAVLEEMTTWAAWTPPGKVSPQVDRITLTYPVLNAARQVVFLVNGEKKAIVLQDILERKACRKDRPAAGVRPVDGRVTWIVDEEAARLLTKR